jgi:hypothetical protein
LREANEELAALADFRAAEGRRGIELDGRRVVARAGSPTEVKRQLPEKERAMIFVPAGGGILSESGQRAQKALSSDCF